MMPYRTGPHGIQIYYHGKALRGVCPNGLEVFVHGHPTLGNLETVDISVITMIEREMIATVEFLAKRKPANAT